MKTDRIAEHDEVECNAPEESVEQTKTIEELAEELEAVAAALKKVAEAKAIAANGIAKAKSRALDEQVANYRLLLQNLLSEEKALLKKQADLETEKLDKELKEMAEALHGDLMQDGEILSEEELAERAEYEKACSEYEEKMVELESRKAKTRAKAYRRGVAGKFFGIVCVIACLVGAVAYLLLAREEVLGLPFDWLYLAADGALAVLCILLSVAFGSAASSASRQCDALDAEMDEEQERFDEITDEFEEKQLAREDEKMLAEADLIAEANVLEHEAILKHQQPKKDRNPIAVAVEGKVAGVKSKVNAFKGNLPEKVQKDTATIGKIAVSAAAVCAAAAVAKKASDKKKSEKVRQNFLKFLGC